MDNPGRLRCLMDDPFKMRAQLHPTRRAFTLPDGARINVAGLENVQVSVARNSVEVELRGDELKDSPVNRDGALHGEKVYVDINRALANANAGKSTLIAQDSLESYQAQTGAHRGRAFDRGRHGEDALAGRGHSRKRRGDRSVGRQRAIHRRQRENHAAEQRRQVGRSGRRHAETRYDGIATRYVKDFGRWNVKKVFDLGQSYRYDPGYVEGKDAGALEVIGMKAMVMQADIQGRTTMGELQREAGHASLRARD